jgi:hypothetical protein
MGLHRPVQREHGTRLCGKVSGLQGLRHQLGELVFAGLEVLGHQ